MRTHRAPLRALSAAGALIAAALAGCRASNNEPANAPSSPPPAQPVVGYAGSTAPPPGYPGTYYAPPQAAYPQAAPGQPMPYAAAPQAAPPAPLPAAPPPAAQPGSIPAPQGAAPYAAPQTTSSPGAAPNAAPPAAAPLAPTDPNSLQSILAGIQGALQGILVAPGSLPVDIAEAGLRAQALRLAPGMQPEGSELKQTLAEGQHAVMMVTLQAGKCYTLLGFSPPGAVKDLDLNLLAPPFYMTLAGQDLSHDNAPSIGASPNPVCPIIPFPLQYKLDVFARSGGGEVAVQLYSKAKQ
ncbi:MAG TPA: hypothetical protein VEK07_06395 [Polyangiaceae bacterium]|nr:hypothetical protein [Polyangiaceae bacterium]